MKTWVDPEPTVIPDELRAAVGGHRLIAERLARRGLSTGADAIRYLDPARYRPASPSALPDLDRAVERLQTAIRRRETILVWGDFDVDGQTATALLVSALRAAGAQVIYHVPNRFNEGHGIHLETLRRLLNSGAGLLLTCDTGIAAHESIAFAQRQGVDVIVTDHHALPDQLPAAHALVNPMRLPPGHPQRELSGVGVAFQVMRGLLGETAAETLLDLVALGLVADVMVLVDDTRYWLQRGLAVLRAAQRPGLRAMLERAEITPTEVNEGHLGFALAPRLNALGRLADATPAVELLTTGDGSRIAVLVNQLEGYNAERKLLSSQVLSGALAQIERDPALLEYAALVLPHPGWHTGVVGVVAARLAEMFNRPVVLLSEAGGEARGSARSVAGCDITAAIGGLRDLVTRFGGHTMAAGLSLPVANLFEFRRRLSVIVRASLGERPPTPTLAVDAYLDWAELSLELAEDISRLAPFGNGNPPLALATRRVRIRGERTLGRRGDHLELQVEDAAALARRVLWWNGADQSLPTGWFDLAYTARVNLYQGRRDLQLEWLDARPAEGERIEIQAPALTYALTDLRHAVDPAGQLARALATDPDALVWREGGTVDAGVDRSRLRAAHTLIVWTPPPGPDEWRRALDTVQPRQVVLLGVDPDLDTLDRFLARLAGLVKYALNKKDGAASLGDLAAASAQREATVQTGLEWLAADGQIHIISREAAVWHIQARGTHQPEARARWMSRLKLALDETAAYRAWWRHSAHV